MEAPQSARLPHAAHCVSQEPCVLAAAFEAPVDVVARDSVQDWLSLD
jgi:hypothetical protein